MTELVILVICILLFYSLAKKYMQVQNDKASIWVAEQKADLQSDLKALDERVEAIKASNGNKWFSIDDIDSKMQ